MLIKSVWVEGQNKLACAENRAESV